MYTLEATTHILSLYGETPIWEVAIRLSLAAAFAAVIGFDRERKDRPAGLRTHMLTAVAAAVFTLVTFEIAFDFIEHDSGSVTVDPVRIIEAVTAGVAFLAAGTIIQSRGRVQGLTTGAGMWMAGALGVASGAGYYVLAGIATGITFLILTVVRRFEKRVVEVESETES